MKILPYYRRATILLSLSFLLLVSGCATWTNRARVSDDTPRTVVVWISVDGVRPDYLQRTSLPFMERMMEEGAYSLALAPIFPSMTFPSHVSQATGVTVDQHGIPMNSFFDPERNRRYFYPPFPFLMEAEPIWTTAQRQGLRVAVYDWVLSHRQSGPHAAAYYGERYDNDTTDKQRVQQLERTWRKDRDFPPLQLLMGYQVMPDTIGHRHGPDSEEVDDSMRTVDEHIKWLAKRAVRIFNRRMNEGDTLYFIVTSDHGMSEVHTVVNPLILTGVDRSEERAEEVLVMASGNLAHVYIRGIEDEARRTQRLDEIIQEASQHAFATVYHRDELPEHWRYAHPTRTGDLVISIPTGYSFGRRLDALKGTPEEAQAPVGMHGYDVEDNPEMNGIMLVWRYPELIGGLDLGSVHSLQLHATVADLLGIEPAEDAHRERIIWDQP